MSHSVFRMQYILLPSWCLHLTVTLSKSLQLFLVQFWKMGVILPYNSLWSLATIIYAKSKTVPGLVNIVHTQCSCSASFWWWWKSWFSFHYLIPWKAVLHKNKSTDSKTRVSVFKYQFCRLLAMWLCIRWFICFYLGFSICKVRMMTRILKFFKNISDVPRKKTMGIGIIFGITILIHMFSSITELNLNIGVILLPPYITSLCVHCFWFPKHLL
jgi:hypothetical protein